MDMKNIVLEELRKIKILSHKNLQNEIELETPPNPELGDFALPCFKFSKHLKMDPKTIASLVASEIPSGGVIKKIHAVGPYVNFFIDRSYIASSVIAEVLKMKNEFGHSIYGAKKKVIIEHTSVNPGKPWHIGHARNAVLGDTLARCYSAAGFETEVHNYIDDLGRQVAVTVWGLKNIADLVQKEDKYDTWLGMIYAAASQKSEDDPKVKEEIGQILHQIEHSGPAAKVAKKMSLDCLKAQLETAKRMNVLYDLLVWESDIVKSELLPVAMKKIKKSPKVKIAEDGKAKGCLIIDLMGIGGFENIETPYKILVRSNNTTTYVAKDIAYQMWKFGLSNANLKFKKLMRHAGKDLWTSWPTGTKKNFAGADIVINVIGSEQDFAQRIVYACLGALGHKTEAANSHHLSYGHVTLADERFSGRKGTWIGYQTDYVLNTASEKALSEVNKRNIDAQEKNKRQISEKIGSGAVRYFLLKFSPAKEVVFDWERVLDFQGNAGPFIQYSQVRARNILKKAKIKKLPPAHFARYLKEPEEIEVVKHMSEFAPAILKTCRENDTSVIANYAFDLADKFNSFYARWPVMQETDEKTRNARILLVAAFVQAMSNVLELLGMKTPEFM